MTTNNIDKRNALFIERGSGRTVMTNKVVEALEKAIETIKIWHGEPVWNIYFNHSPEMKKIRSALPLAKAQAEFCEAIAEDIDTNPYYSRNVREKYQAYQDLLEKDDG